MTWDQRRFYKTDVLKNAVAFKTILTKTIIEIRYSTSVLLKASCKGPSYFEFF